MKEREEKLNKNGGLDKALGFTAVALVLFVISIEVMFYICREVPEALIVGVLGTGGAECGFGALIYIFKSKWGKKKKEEDEECEENDDDDEEEDTLDEAV